VVSVVRRRREAGLLKAIGFVRRQIAWSISWQTSTIALIGIVIGVPAGTLLVANLLAIGPALVASRSHPASLLKAE
jgi:ABC-type antimicrobial peptide transport system permease subunit